MTETAAVKKTADLTIEKIDEALSQNDLNDLCDATDAAIEGGGGFGWLHMPQREGLERYWQGVVAAPTRWLFVARLDGVICGTTQVVLPPNNNEAQSHAVQLTTNFVAPWARGHGLAPMLLQKVEEVCRQAGYAVINLDVREHMARAIEVYEGLGYIQFGSHPYSVRDADGNTVASCYYYKVINPAFFE